MTMDSTAGRPPMATEETTSGTALNPLAILGAAGIGAALMYFLDPDRGNRRRRLVTDQLAHTQRVAGDALGVTTRDLTNRARGVVAATRSRFTWKDVDDAVLVGRIRSKLGRLVSHPSAVVVHTQDGHVTVSGPVLANEVGELLAGIRGMHGVREVENRLTLHQGEAQKTSGAQREGASTDATSPRAALPDDGWSPATRIIRGGAGTALALYGARRKDAVGTVLGLAGGALALRGITNLPAKRLTGIAARRRAVDVQKTITIYAPVERVFQFFTEWENWPRWMSHVREVRHAGVAGSHARTHWVVDGPAGTTVEWDALVTKLVPDKALAWKSVDGAVVQHAGMIRFTPTADGATTVDVNMSYNPPAGAIRHAAATLFARDPKHQMDDDLAQLKTTIERGTPPHDAAEPVPDSAAAVSG